MLGPIQSGGPAPLTPLSSIPTDGTWGEGLGRSPSAAVGGQESAWGVGVWGGLGVFSCREQPWLGSWLLAGAAAPAARIILPPREREKSGKQGRPGPGRGHPTADGDTPRQAGTPHSVLALRNGADRGWGAETPGSAGSGGAGMQGLGIQGLPRSVQECRTGGSRRAQICGCVGCRDERTPGGCRDPKRDGGSGDVGTPQGFRGAGNVHWERVW